MINKTQKMIKLIDILLEDEKYPKGKYVQVTDKKELEREFTKLKDGAILTDGNSRIRDLNKRSLIFTFQIS